jgi:hypothetical protein
MIAVTAAITTMDSLSAALKQLKEINANSKLHQNIWRAVPCKLVTWPDICVSSISVSEQGSSVSTVSGYGLDGRVSIPDRGRGFLL